MERRHGAYVFIRSGAVSGWVERAQIGVIAE